MIGNPIRKFFETADTAVPAVLAWIIQRSFPPTWWYRSAFQLSRLLAPALRLRRRSVWNGTLCEAVFINRILALLTRTGQAFPVPWEAQGLDMIPAYLNQPGGVVLCSAHLPLVKVACRAMMDLGIPIAAAITDNPSVTDSLAIWGRTDRMAALKAGPHVLAQVRSLLRAGKAILLLVDTSPGQNFSPNIFHLAKRLRTKVFLFSVDLAHDGVILVRLFAPAEASVEGKLRELRCEVDRILLRQSCPEPIPPTRESMIVNQAGNQSVSQ